MTPSPVPRFILPSGRTVRIELPIPLNITFNVPKPPMPPKTDRLGLQWFWQVEPDGNGLAGHLAFTLGSDPALREALAGRLRQALQDLETAPAGASTVVTLSLQGLLQAAPAPDPAER